MSTIILVSILIFSVLLALVTGFNLSNTCSVWFFHKFENVNTLLALFAAFIFGMLVMLIFVVLTRNHKKAPPKEKPVKEPKQKTLLKKSKQKDQENSPVAAETEIQNTAPAEQNSEIPKNQK